MEETNYPARLPVTKTVQSEKEFAEPMPSSDRVIASKENTTTERCRDVAMEDGHVKVSGPTKSYLSKLSLYHRRSFQQPNRLLERAWRPLVLLTFPVISWCGFMYGSGLILFNVLNDSASLILGGSPYNFRPDLIGLAYISPLIGVFLVHFYTGPLGDRFALWLARKHGGILEAEFRLWLFLPSLLLVPFGLILWGVGAVHGIHWFGEVFAMGVIAASALVALQLPIAYCLDSYYKLASEAIVTVILIRNSMSFAIGYGITPWLQNMGLQNAFITCAFAGLAVTFSFVPMAIWGKRLRIVGWNRYERAALRVNEEGASLQSFAST